MRDPRTRVRLALAAAVVTRELLVTLWRTEPTDAAAAEVFAGDMTQDCAEADDALPRKTRAEATSATEHTMDTAATADPVSGRTTT